MMLGMVEDVKGKLGVPIEDTSRDAEIELCLESSSAWVAERARVTEEAEDRVELHRSVRAGDAFTLDRRPVDESKAFTLEARLLGADDWTTVEHDLLDPQEGIVVMVSDAWWPPTTRPLHSERVWPVVRATFTTEGVGSGTGAPKALRSACAALAAYWFERHAAGAASDQQAGPLRETILTLGVPAWVESEISSYLDDEAAACV